MVGDSPLYVRGVGESHEIVKQTDSGFEVDAQESLGSPLSPEALLNSSLPHDLVMGGISRAGSWHLPLFYFLRQPDVIQSRASECSVKEFSESHKIVRQIDFGFWGRCSSRSRGSPES